MEYYYAHIYDVLYMHNVHFTYTVGCNCICVRYVCTSTSTHVYGYEYVMCILGDLCASVHVRNIQVNTHHVQVYMYIMC